MMYLSVWYRSATTKKSLSQRIAIQYYLLYELPNKYLHKVPSAAEYTTIVTPAGYIPR